MDPIQKALWFVESHSHDPLTLEDIARTCHVSAFHLTRAFAATMGVSLMRYVRARRLSEAARQLADGAADILHVALGAGYSSHEAFTRAFRDQFDLTPEQVRAQGHITNLAILEPILMQTTTLPDLLPPRFETSTPRLIAGFAERYDCQSPAGIPQQWQRLQPYLGNVPGQLGPVAYGVCYNFDSDGNFDYLCGVEVKDDARLPKGFVTVNVPSHQYAVFTHQGHVVGIRATIAAIWSKWFPASEYQAANAPTVERYGPEFNPTTGLGGFEIWVPVQPRA